MYKRAGWMSMLLAAGSLFMGIIGCGSSPLSWWTPMKVIKPVSSDEKNDTMLQYTILSSKAPLPQTEGEAIFFNEGPNELELELKSSLKANTDLKFQVKFCAVNQHANFIRLKTGIGKEEIEVKLAPVNGGQLAWRVSTPDGKSDSYSMQNGGIAKRSFSWSDNLLFWSEIYAKAAQHKYNEEWTRIALEFRPKTLRLLINGIIMKEWEASPELWGKKLTLTMPKGLRVRLPESQAAFDNPLYGCVDISSRFNAKGLGGESLDASSLPQRGEQSSVKGIPFLMPPLAQNGDDHMDVGISWFREGNLTSYEEPHQGAFGGRWAGALSNNPTRLQFRVPMRQYNAIYLIAASDERENSVPIISAQFYRPGAGFPKSFTAKPVASCRESTPEDTNCLPVKTGNGCVRYLHLLKIPVDPAQLQEFSDSPILEFELTKGTQTYRAYPDPFYYSVHGAGLPSSVQVFALTMGVAPVSVEFNPESYANIWTEPSTVSYAAKITNNTLEEKELKLSFTASSFNKEDKYADTKKILLKPQASSEIKFSFAPKKFGHYDVSLSALGKEFEQDYPRTLSYLRKREHKAREFDAKGFMFGFWNWGGGHKTPESLDIFRIMGPTGVEALGTGVHAEKWASPELIKMMETYGIKSYLAFGSSDLWAVSYLAKIPDDDQKALEQVIESYKKGLQEKSPVSEPMLVRVFAEPGGLGTHGAFPEFYGEPEEPLKEKQLENFNKQNRKLGLAVKAAKTLNPNVKILMPHGDICYPIPFLKNNDENTKALDGVAIDIGFFERLPEQQIHQCSLHRMMMLNHYWKKYKNTEARYVTFEGPCIAPVMEGALTERQYAAHLVRSCMILGAYGVKRQFTPAAPADCADWWGEQHYGGGLLSRMNGLNPHLAYSSFATMVRHLRNMEFIGWIPMGSLSSYCLKFKDSTDGKFMYALWTIRGKREARFAVNGDLEIYDSMDNLLPGKSNGGNVSISLSDMPIYVYGLSGTPSVTLGKTDHSDSKPGENIKLLGNSAELFVRQAQDSDPEYLESFPEAVRRFPAEMKLSTIEAPMDFGSKALSIELPPQAKDRGVMPFYTTLHPKKALEIPGKGQYISIWAKGASDWGRIVYVLRDSKGEKWISVGSKGEWNSDDTPNASFFNFDGWRLLKFELPAHTPYDCFREKGTTWWGSSGGDGIVDLPLSLEKIFVERRPKAMYVNSLEETTAVPVELGDIMIEYAKAEDMGEEAIKLARLRMPQPPNAELPNPIAELAETATLAANKIIAVEQPGSAQDGTRGVFKFQEMPEAVRYDIYLSLYPDGRGALKLGNGLKKSGEQVNGFRANTDFYAFVIYYDKKGNFSKPSEAFKFKLDNIFGMR